MRKKHRLLALLLLFVFTFSLAGCGGGGDTAWEYPQVITTPLKATSAGEAVSLGNLDSNQVKIDIPGRTFDKATAVTVATPKKVPKVMGKEITPLGSPIEITSGSTEGTRLNEPVTITMKLDKEAIKGKTDPGSFWVTYYNGENWDYIKPDKVDLNAGTLTFTTYHFSLFGYGEISVDERLKKWTQNEALVTWAHGAVNSKFDEAAGKVIDHILTDKLGIEDESMKMKVLGSLLKDGEWGDIRKNIQEAYANGTSVDQVTDLNEKINLLACKKIVDIVPKSKLSKALEGITDDFGAGTVKAASQAAGALAAGNKLEAVRIMGTHLSDQFIATTAIKIAASAVQLQIDWWRNSEVEAAYKVYKNGASSKIPFWGYNVEKGNFDELWEQMKGVSRQLCIEAIQAQEQVRREAGYPPLTDAEKDRIRALVKNDLEKQFKQRMKDDEEVAAEQEKLKELVDKYKEAKLLEVGMFGYDKQYSMEQRLDLLTHLKDKILKDTGRKGLTNGAFSNKTNVSYADLVALTQAWYTKPDGWQKYAQMVKEKFGIDLFPTAEEMNGLWNGTFTITYLNMPQSSGSSPQKSSGGGPGDQIVAGCEALGPEIIKSLINNPLPATYNLQLDKNGSGTLGLTINTGRDSGAQTYPVSYNSGLLTVSASKDGGVVNMKGMVNKDNDNKVLIINGTATGSGQGVTLKAVWNCRKSMLPTLQEAKPDAGNKNSSQNKK
ncbi:hypothetical protein [Syntrophomonas palmitatica]|uniref:hypothetical protein n=1 Tax=Syntrophomonas palmitatica TaxID=402877 RepID=UPI0006D07029|nr:hypothetical protein [Syntrophomonas palmitatica]